MPAKRVGIDGRCFQDGSVYRGTGRYVQGLLAGLAVSGGDDLEYQVVLDDGEGWEHRDPPGLDEHHLLDGHPTRRATLQVRDHSWLRRNRVLRRSLAALDLDLLHVPAQFYLYHQQRFSLPYVVTVLDMIPFVRDGALDPGGSRRSRRRLSRLKAICRRAAHLIAISEHTRGDCVRMMDLPEDRITVIPLGVDDRFRPEGLDDEVVWRRHGLRRPYVLYVGSQDPHKNLETLIDAVDELRRTGHDLQLVLVGRKKEERPGQDRSWVHYPDYVPDSDLPAVYRGAAAFSTLSTYEGFCLPLLEAMACGTPTVGSDASVIPETVGDAGLLVDPRDARAAAAAIGAVLNDGSLAAQLRTRAVARAKRYRWEKVGRAHQEVYRRALEGR